MIRRPPRSTRTDTLFPYTTLFRSEINLVAGRADVGRNRGADLERTVNLAALDVLVERRDKVEIILVGRRRAKVFLGDADDLDRRILVELVRPEGHLDAVSDLDNPAVLADALRIAHHRGIHTPSDHVLATTMHYGTGSHAFTAPP